MCWCNPNNRTPECGNIDCHPPIPVPPYAPVKTIKSKPPIGIMPEKLWRLKRCQELTEAINRYLIDDDLNFKLVLEWAVELKSHLYAMKDLEL